jgi:hypothetical protein
VIKATSKPDISKKTKSREMATNSPQRNRFCKNILLNIVKSIKVNLIHLIIRSQQSLEFEHEDEEEAMQCLLIFLKRLHTEDQTQKEEEKESEAVTEDVFMKQIK